MNWTNNILFSSRTKLLKTIVEKAVESGVDLSEVDLPGAIYKGQLPLQIQGSRSL